MMERLAAALALLVSLLLALAIVHDMHRYGFVESEGRPAPALGVTMLVLIWMLLTLGLGVLM